MIPERVVQITSVTTQKNKLFDTPIGLFSFKHLPISRYAIGMHIEKVSDTTHYLIATPEKVLCDLVTSAGAIKNRLSMQTFLWDDMRMDPSVLVKLSMRSLVEIARHYQHNNVNLLVEVLKDMS